jgi:nucleotide-binding universal stress UspA family protein
MIKSVLLHAHDDDAMGARLQVALDVCRAFDAHLTVLHVTPFNASAAFDPLGGIAAQGVILEDMHDREAELRTATEARLGREDVRWDWSSQNGEVANMIVKASALSDLIIVSQQATSASQTSNPLPIIDDVAIHASCAVLVVPQGVKQINLSGAAVIGWNASPEAAHAIRAAVPFLKTASFVHIASVGENGADYPQTDANAYLSRHGIKSDLHELQGANRNAGEALHEFAASKMASCLVIGAYGRSRFRELLLGGTTRSLLSTSTIPLLLTH